MLASLLLSFIASITGAWAGIQSDLIETDFKKGHVIEFVRQAPDGNPVVLVDLSRLKVTQEYIGKKIVVDEMLPRYLKKSADEVQKKALADTVDGILFLDQDGKYSVFHLDGHHRSYTYLLYNEAKKANIRMNVKLIDDYTGKFGGKKLSFAEMADDLISKKKKTYATTGKSPLEQFTFLNDPTHDQISEVKNCDLRTDVGSALYFLDWKSEPFKDYLEFYIAEDLTPQHLGCAAPESQNYPGAQTPPRLAEIQKQIFAGKGCTVLKRLKSDYLRPGLEKEGIRALKKTKKKFDAKFPDLKNACSI